MFAFAKKWFGPGANPIGVDFGSDSLKMAQVAWAGGEPQLIAAAAAEVPGHVRASPGARLAWFAETARELLGQGKFRGRQAVLALPAAQMFIQHLRLPKMDDATLRKALPWEARGKLPIDPSHCILRHSIAGEIYHDQEPKHEIILMAAARQMVNDLLAAAAKAKLDVVAMNVEPATLVNCFGHIYRRKDDAAAVNCFVDIGSSSSRAVIAQGGHVRFARSIKIGGEHLNRAVASSMRMNMDDARMLRTKLACLQPSLDEHRLQQSIDGPDEVAAGAAAAPARGEVVAKACAAEGEEGAGEGVATSLLTMRDVTDGGRFEPAAKPPAAKPVKLPDDPGQQARLVEQACAAPIAQLAEELDRCRQYYEMTFPNKPIDRLVFVGGEAKHRGLCQHVARHMQLAAQVGDPIVRMGRTTKVGIESGLDRRQPQPGWAIAIGLSLGPVSPDADANQQLT